MGAHGAEGEQRPTLVVKGEAHDRTAGISFGLGRAEGKHKKRNADGRREAHRKETQEREERKHEKGMRGQQSGKRLWVAGKWRGNSCNVPRKIARKKIGS